MYLLKTKDEVISKFQEFKTKAEKPNKQERMEGSYDGRISTHHDVWKIVPRPKGKSIKYR
jgi:hypothetical protein